MKLFREIKIHKSSFKDRFILDCERLSIGRLILIAGATGSGKSTLAELVQKNAFAEHLACEDLSSVPLVSPNRIWKKPLHQLFPRNAPENALMTYDIGLIERRKLHSFFRDPATDLFDCTRSIDTIILLPEVEGLKSQLHQSEIAGAEKPRSFHVKQLARYGRKNYLRDLYLEWTHFLRRKDLNISRLFVYTDSSDGNGRSLRRIDSFDEADAFIREVYG